jgi:hypothetical protein
MTKLTPNRRIWRICIAVVAVIVLITYTPVIIPADRINPSFLGFPYTLWMGITLTIILVILTYIGSKVFPSQNEEEDSK